MEPKQPTLLPVTTLTATERQRPAEPAPEVSTVMERTYRLEPTDRVWLGLSSLIVERGNRYSDGLEETLRVENYGEDLIRAAVLQLVREMQRQADPKSDAGDFCRARAVSFLADLTQALGVAAQ
jgi:hypothetical protein